jgi:hypothetical protein
VPLDAVSLFVSASLSDAATNTTSTAAVIAVTPPPDTEPPTITFAVVPDPALAGQSASLEIDGTDNVGIVGGNAQVTAATTTTTVVIFSDSFSGPLPYGGTFSVPLDAVSLFVSASLSDAATNTTSTAAVVAVVPPAAPPVAGTDSLQAPPVHTRGYDVSANDTFDTVTAQFLLVAPPQVTTLSPELFQWNGDGTFSYTMPSSRFTDFLTYRISDANGVSGVTSVFFSRNNTLLTNLPVFIEEGVEKVSVPALAVDGLHYPLYQIVLALADVCPTTHYHCGLVFPLEQPTLGISDPDPARCGLGTFTPFMGEVHVLQEAHVVTQTAWQAFLAAHPPL